MDKNLQYPKEALEAKIEGEVEAEYFVNGLGKIKNIKVLKGIDHGCDEEVIRLINLQIYEKAINRGLRAMNRKTLLINLRLPKPKSVQVNYNIVSTTKDKKVLTKI